MRELNEIRTSRVKRVSFVLMLSLCCSFIFPVNTYAGIDPSLSSGNTANAYIDPSTGSLALQVILGVLVAGGVTIKVFWAKIVTWVKKVTKHQSSSEEVGK